MILSNKVVSLLGKYLIKMFPLRKKVIYQIKILNRNFCNSVPFVMFTQQSLQAIHVTSILYNRI